MYKFTFLKGMVVMKTSKKVIALVLSVVMLVGCFSATAFAVEEAYTPSIVIPGIFQSETKYYENGMATNAEPPFADVNVMVFTKQFSRVIFPVARPIKPPDLPVAPDVISAFTRPKFLIIAPSPAQQINPAKVLAPATLSLLSTVKFLIM